MTFGPTVDSIVLQLLQTDFTACDLKKINDAEVDIRDVALVELKLWIDFGDAIGDLVINKNCVQIGRDNFLKNILMFLAEDKVADRKNAMRRSQICTTRGATEVASICADDDCYEISQDHYSRGISNARKSLKPVFEKILARGGKIDSVVPLCDDP